MKECLLFLSLAHESFRDILSKRLHDFTLTTFCVDGGFWRETKDFSPIGLLFLPVFLDPSSSSFLSSHWLSALPIAFVLCSCTRYRPSLFELTSPILDCEFCEVDLYALGRRPEPAEASFDYRE